VGIEKRQAKIRVDWTLVLTLSCTGVLIWGAWTWRRGQHYRHAMTEIRSEMATGRFAIAARKLGDVLAWRPKSDEATYLLGVCEQESGRPRAAAAAWARVAPDSAYAEKAILARVQLLDRSGNVSGAEQLVASLSLEPRIEKTGVCILLVPIYRQLGRLDEARRKIEARWEYLNEIGKGAMEPAIQMLRMHIELTGRPPSVESIREYLGRASRQAPADDRIWLGRANLAIQTGDLDEAKRWLGACVERRPSDVAVWRARLNWSLAARRVDILQEALKHIPAVETSSAQVHRVCAWLFSERGDIAGERGQLEKLIDADPADRTAIDRLVQLAEHGGRTADAVELRRKAIKIDLIRTRYEQLHERKQPVRSAVEMSRLAQALGRRFEARAFLTLAIAENYGSDDLRRDLLRLIPAPSTVEQAGQTLADLVYRELAKSRKSGTD
jgi:enediyne biosynthesis protein E4